MNFFRIQCNFILYKYINVHTLIFFLRARAGGGGGGGEGVGFKAPWVPRTLSEARLPSAGGKPKACRYFSKQILNFPWIGEFFGYNIYYLLTFTRKKINDLC